QVQHLGASSSSGDDLASATTRPLLGAFNVFDSTWGSRAHLTVVEPLVQYVANRVDDSEETHSPGMEGVNQLFVGSVVDGWRAAPGRAWLAGEVDRGKPLGVQRLERPRLRERPVDGERGAGHSIRPAEGQCDRQAHVRR